MLFATMQRRFQVLSLVLVLMAIDPPAGLAAGQDPAARPPAGYEEALGRAAAALKQGDHAAGLVSLDAALRIHPEGFEAFMLLGQAYMKLERYAEASSAFRRGADLAGPATPEGLDALCSLAASMGREERNEDALKVLRQVLEAQPRRAAIHHDMGRIHLALGRLQAAAEQFRAEIELGSGQAMRPPGSQAAAALDSSWEGLGVATYRSGDDQAALAALAKAPPTIESLYHKGLALQRRGLHEEAAAALREVLAIDPEHRGAMQNLARSAGALGREQERRETIARFQELYRKDEQQRALTVRVKNLRADAARKAESRDFAAAAAALEEAVTLSPDDITLLLDFGRLLHLAGDAGRSEQVFRDAVRRRPDHAEARLRLGRVLAERGDVPGAVAAFEQAARLAPMNASHHLHLAQVYLRAGRTEEGVRELRLAGRLDPDNPDSLFNLGLGLAQAGSLREAAEELEKAVALGYRDARVHQVLAQVYAGLGDQQRSRSAQQTYERLTEKKP